MIGNAVIAAFCTLVVAVGWYYLAHSRGVDVLAGVESPGRNLTRRRARRMGAWAMIVAALAGFWLVLELRWRPPSGLRIGLTLLLLTLALLAMMISVLIDTYLTNRIRRRGPRP